MEGKGKMWLICCGANGRAVLLGYCEEEPVAGQPIKTTRCRMVLRWRNTGGLLGLAAHGPKEGTRITAPVDFHGDECVRQYTSVSDEAAAAIEAWPPA